MVEPSSSSSAGAVPTNHSQPVQAFSSRAYDVEGTVGRMKAWNDVNTNVGDIEVDPLDSLLQAGINRNLASALDQLNEVSSSNTSVDGDDSESDSDDFESVDDEEEKEMPEENHRGNREVAVRDNATNNDEDVSVLAVNGLHAQPDVQAVPQATDIFIQDPLNNPVDPAAADDADMAAEGDNEFIDPEDNLENLNDQAADVHIALDRLLGLRAFGNLLRNSLWLLAFNFVFIAIFVALPYLIGLATINTFENSAMTSKLYQISRNLFPIFVLVTEEALRKSAASGDAFQVLDLILLGFGYSITFFMIFSLNEVIKASAKYVTSLRGPFAAMLSNFSNVIKVGLLLYLRVFFLPIVLGGMIMRFLDVFLDYPVKWWVDFFSSNIAGAGALAWVLGITYMVTTTLTVLQLREVLHPRFLASFVRPQEPHLDLLNSLMIEPMWVHCRRICASMLIYMSFLIMFVLVPLHFIRSLSNPFMALYAPGFSGFGGMEPVNSLVNLVVSNVTLSESGVDGNATSVSAESYRNPRFVLHFCYYIPQIQIPFEVTIAHFTILTLVDRKKNVIGRCMHTWLVHMCKLLGLTRLLLPHAYLKSVDGAAQAAQIAENNTSNTITNNMNGGILYDVNGAPLVGPPLRRPLPGWDSKTNRNMTRWAWINEPLSDLERSVAPVVVPSLCWLRLCALLVTVWMTLSSFSMMVIFGPVMIGRVVLIYLQMPFFSSPRVHDPLSFGIGCLFLGASVTLASRISTRKLARYARSVGNIPSNLVTAGMLLTQNG
jgi:hypothetical protein